MESSLKSIFLHRSFLPATWLTMDVTEVIQSAPSNGCTTTSSPMALVPLTRLFPTTRVSSVTLRLFAKTVLQTEAVPSQRSTTPIESASMPVFQRIQSPSRMKFTTEVQSLAASMQHQSSTSQAQVSFQAMPELKSTTLLQSSAGVSLQTAPILLTGSLETHGASTGATEGT